MIICELCNVPPRNEERKATHRYRDVDGHTYNTCPECTGWIQDVSDCDVWKIPRSSSGKTNQGLGETTNEQ